MAQIVPLPSPGEEPEETARPKRLEIVAPPASDSVVCSLCGLALAADARRFVLVSPMGGGRQVVVCSMCRRAALGEGYRPAV